MNLLQANGQIGDQVWLDTTPDGVFNSGTEPGIGNDTRLDNGT